MWNLIFVPNFTSCDRREKKSIFPFDRLLSNEKKKKNVKEAKVLVYYLPFKIRCFADA